MFQFLFRKFARVIIILLGVALITFLLMHLIPGNPWSNNISSVRMFQFGLDEGTQRELERRFGLDLPLWRQFTRYIIGDVNDDGSFFCGVVCGNLGPSFQARGRSVQSVLFEPPNEMSFLESRFGYSIRLVLLASLIAAGLGIPLGIISAMKPKSALSRIIAVGLSTLISIPSFVLGLLGIIVLASWLKLINVLPNWDYPSNWIMPAVVLAMMPMASIARVTRSALINIMHEDYVRAARAKGLTQNRVMLVHVMRVALAPIITFLGPTLMELFTGLFIVENLYAFPGFGRQYWMAILTLDYPMIMGLTLIYAVGIVLINVLVEMLSEKLDPRIRLARQGGAV
jgi:oligopeptide transport system permease protein